MKCKTLQKILFLPENQTKKELINFFLEAFCEVNFIKFSYARFFFTSRNLSYKKKVVKKITLTRAIYCEANIKKIR